MIGEKIELSEKITEIDWINSLKYQIIKEINFEIKTKTFDEVVKSINKLDKFKKALFKRVIHDIVLLKKQYEEGDTLAKIKLTNYGLLIKRKKDGNK
jgi:hypothetical protein